MGKSERVIYVVFLETEGHSLGSSGVASISLYVINTH